MIKGGIILKAAAIYGALVLSLIGIIVVESAETIKTGYQIAYLNKIWQEKNFEFIERKKECSQRTGSDAVVRFAREKFALRFPEPEELVFIDGRNDASK